ncbi:hypothetical protein RYX36_013147 [Vicia faba]
MAQRQQRATPFEFTPELELDLKRGIYRYNNHSKKWKRIITDGDFRFPPNTKTEVLRQKWRRMRRDDSNLSILLDGPSLLADEMLGLGGAYRVPIVAVGAPPVGVPTAPPPSVGFLTAPPPVSVASPPLVGVPTATPPVGVHAPPPSVGVPTAPSPVGVHIAPPPVGVHAAPPPVGVHAATAVGSAPDGLVHKDDDLLSDVNELKKVCQKSFSVLHDLTSKHDCWRLSVKNKFAHIEALIETKFAHIEALIETKFEKLENKLEKLLNGGNVENGGNVKKGGNLENGENVKNGGNVENGGNVKNGGKE